MFEEERSGCIDRARSAESLRLSGQGGGGVGLRYHPDFACRLDAAGPSGTAFTLTAGRLILHARLGVTSVRLGRGCFGVCGFSAVRNCGVGGTAHAAGRRAAYCGRRLRLRRAALERPSALDCGNDGSSGSVAASFASTFVRLCSAK